MSDLRSVEVLGFKVVCRFSVGLSNSDVGSSVGSEVSAVSLSVAGGVAFEVFIPSEGLGWFALPAAPNYKGVGNFY